MEKEMKQQAANTFTTSPKTGWNSPIPWLFGSLALMLGLILVALIILIYSYRCRNQSPPTEEKLAKSSTAELQLDFVPVVVIMAGDDNPTYVATPIPSNDHYFSNEV
ncbi:putative Glutamine dumper 2 [Heracleum sosnowskyi]|uniref:Glutamine dumper 2 n=1 Tax=Heracleum sosnowskyi TaxID=360622 RepID=A0AAD8ICS5_9APIA|nr:putative Glutamine dumper 2 [Heracleum sosnowskyi]